MKQINKLYVFELQTHINIFCTLVKLKLKQKIYFATQSSTDSLNKIKPFS